jgi:tagatose-6-phosphate ketose/aldose isomerase
MTDSADLAPDRSGFADRTADDLAAAGATWTAREIAQQPTVWQQVAALVDTRREKLERFLAPLLADRALRIVLTGAGTSAYIGDCLAPALSRHLQRRVEAIATTDLVAGPERWLQRDVPTLVVSFARSGNSPESVATLDLCERLLDRVHHLIVTCNAEGALARSESRLRDACVLVLPEATNDRGFAMTSSFTSMLVTASVVFGLLTAAGVVALACAGAATMARSHAFAERLASRRFERVVFLGSNELRGLASEAALKLLELTDGRTVAMADSVLGFRHGPKTVINAGTLVVVMLSNDLYARAYDRDLLGELHRDARAGKVLAIGTRREPLDSVEQLDLDHPGDASDIEIALLDALFAQILALRQSLALGITPDRPNASGVVNRVVQGVTIHRWPAD